MIVIVALTLVMMACGLFGAPPRSRDKIVILTRLPTLTPTSLAGGGAAEVPAAPAAPAVPEIPPVEGVVPPPEVAPTDPLAPPSDPSPPSMPLTVPDAAGWSFTGVRAQYDPNTGGVQVYGNLVNNTGATQELQLITGTALDPQGQVIATPDVIYAQWPMSIIPAGVQTPFVVTVPNVQSLASISLNVGAVPNEVTLRQDFELLDTAERDEGGLHCASGALRNPGEALAEYLLVVMTLYDSEDNVITFGDYFASAPDIGGDQTEPFEICVEVFGQSVARSDLQVWGR